MNTAEHRLRKMLKRGTDSYYGRDYANGAPQSSEAQLEVAAATARKPYLSQQMFNPNMVAQFTLNVEVYYFTVVTATGVYTEILAAALSSALKTKLSFFAFGQTDQQAGYVLEQSRFPLNGWNYGIPFIYGYQNPTVTPELDGTVLAKFDKGDMVFPFTSALPGSGTTTLAVVVLKCPEVAYAKMLAETNSNGFVLNMIRYNVASDGATDLAQYNNIIYWNIDSMFGAVKGDKISPLASKVPEQFQSGIIDIPLNIQVTKEVVFGSYINYDIVRFTWNIFVAQVQKVI